MKVGVLSFVCYKLPQKHLQKLFTVVFWFPALMTPNYIILNIRLKIKVAIQMSFDAERQKSVTDWTRVMVTLKCYITQGQVQFAGLIPAFCWIISAWSSFPVCTLAVFFDRTNSFICEVCNNQRSSMFKSKLTQNCVWVAKIHYY